MAQYPIKMLKDENGTPFVPLVAPEAVKDNQGTDWQTLLNSKLEKTNIIAGDNITLSVSGNNITINSQAGGATTNVIDNLNQQTAGIGVLDAHQGYVLKGMIPGVQNTLTSTSTTDALSAYQGYLLSNRVVPSGGTTGQVLRKKSGTDNDVEWSSIDLSNYLAKDNTDSYTPTADYNPATKKYVDDNTLPYYDSGYYMTPTRWTIVSELPDYPASNTLYFVSPDYVEQYINTNVTSNGFNSGVTWSHITNLFMKTDDHTDIVETWQNTAPNSGSQSTSWQVHAPKYDVAVGATPNFTNSNSEDLYMHGVLEQRDPQTTALRYSAYLNVESNLASGTTYYFDSDDYDTPTVSGAIPIYIPGSTSFFYTIGTNGGLACLKGDTPIKTKGSKTKQIKNIEVGDVVTDAEGNGTEVIKIYKHTIPETYNITLSNGDTLVASPCHKFSIKGRYRYACQVVKDHKLDRGDGSTFDVTATEVKQEEMEVYEILTKSGTYTLANGIICECEAI